MLRKKWSEQWRVQNLLGSRKTPGSASRISLPQSAANPSEISVERQARQGARTGRFSSVSAVVTSPTPSWQAPTPPHWQALPELLPCICLILCKAKVFLHGLLSLALTDRANETIALSSLMTQLIYFKHLKRTPPSANLPAASHSQHAGTGAA